MASKIMNGMTVFVSFHTNYNEIYAIHYTVYAKHILYMCSVQFTARFNTFANTQRMHTSCLMHWRQFFFLFICSLAFIIIIRLLFFLCVLCPRYYIHRHCTSSSLQPLIAPTKRALHTNGCVRTKVGFALRSFIYLTLFQSTCHHTVYPLYALWNQNEKCTIKKSALKKEQRKSVIQCVVVECYNVMCHRIHTVHTHTLTLTHTMYNHIFARIVEFYLIIDHTWDLGLPFFTCSSRNIFI